MARLFKRSKVSKPKLHEGKVKRAGKKKPSWFSKVFNCTRAK